MSCGRNHAVADHSGIGTSSTCDSCHTGDIITSANAHKNTCSNCHAADGTGNNWIGSFMQPHPRDLTQAENVADVSREQLRNVIISGLPGTSMPAWGNVLTATEINNLITYLKRAFGNSEYFDDSSVPVTERKAAKPDHNELIWKRQ